MIKTILAVEDDKSVLDVYMRLLAAPDRSVARAASVAEAESLIGRNSYDLLITDLALPDGLGTELIDLLEKKGAGTKSLIVSGNLTPEASDRTGKGNFIGCFEKPVNFQKLLAAVGKALDG
jgi:DNA-binding NtrC family response regulator